MTAPTIIQSRVAELLNGGFIASGGHSEDSGERCIQEWCAYIAGEPHGAMPACVSPVLRDYSIQINDRWPDGPRQLLAPYGLRMLGTAGDGQDDAMSAPMSSQAPRYDATRVDRARNRRSLTRKARGLLLALVVGLACWIGAALALVWLLGVAWR